MEFEDIKLELENTKSIAKILYNMYKQSNTPRFHIEQIKNHFYGALIVAHIEELYKLLADGKHTAKNPLRTGDDDEGSWIEPAKDEYTRIIAIERYCSCADDNTHIFVLKQIDDYVEFKCNTAWPRQVRSPWSFGDHRDIKVPSIQTFRNSNFKFGYEDGRDKHYVFKYNSVTDNVNDSHITENKILWALESLVDCVNTINEESSKVQHEI